MSCKKKRALFTDLEIRELLELWASEKTQQMFGKSMRHTMIWNGIAEELAKRGYSKTGDEVKSKINNLKTEYRNMKPKSGDATPTWPYYSIIHEVLGQRDSVNDELLDDSIERHIHPKDDAESYNMSGYVPDEVGKSKTLTAEKSTTVRTASDEHETTVDEKLDSTRNIRIKKIARSPRTKRCDESELIKTLIESEKRYNQRLASIEEQERRSQDREDSMADSMNRFLKAFAVLAENSVGTMLLGSTATGINIQPNQRDLPSSSSTSNSSTGKPKTNKNASLPPCTNSINNIATNSSQMRGNHGIATPSMSLDNVISIEDDDSMDELLSPGESIYYKNLDENTYNEDNYQQQTAKQKQRLDDWDSQVQQKATTYSSLKRKLQLSDNVGQQISLQPNPDMSSLDNDFMQEFPSFSDSMHFVDNTEMVSKVPKSSEFHLTTYNKVLQQKYTSKRKLDNTIPQLTKGYSSLKGTRPLCPEKELASEPSSLRQMDKPQKCSALTYQLQNPSPDGHMLKIPKKASIKKGTNGLIYLTLPKND